MPPLRRVVLKAALAFERLLTGVRLSDAHNGFRAFNRRCAEVVQLKQNRMAHATEFKQLVARNGLRYVERPVSIRYTEETLRKGQQNMDGLKVLKDLLTVYLFG